MSLPTEGETFTQLIHCCRRMQELATQMAVLRSDKRWLKVATSFQLTELNLTELAQRKVAR